MKVTVTQRDINKGVPYEPGGCPISLAIQRNRGVERASVGLESASIEKSSGNKVEYVLPRAAREFIQSFDTKEAVKPIIFTMKRL